jgi:hypothetical protein
LCSNPKRTGYTEKDSVVLHLRETIVSKERAGVRIHIRPGVLCLASLPITYEEEGLDEKKKFPLDTHLEQNTGDDIVDLAYKLEEFVIRQMLERKLPLCDIARVCLAEHCMAIARDNLAALQRGPDILLDCLVTSIFSDLGLHFGEPYKHLLVREAMQRTGKAVKCSRI